MNTNQAAYIAGNKKFVFINFSIGLRITGVNHGIAFLAPILKRYLYNVTLLNLAEEIGDEEFINIIKKLNPSIVGFSFTTHQYKYFLKYSWMLKKMPLIFQIAGGVHATLDPIDILSKTPVRGVCVGEGDIPLEDLLNIIDAERDITDAKGFYWKTNGLIKKNTIPQFVSDLSLREFPDYSIFERDFVVRDWSVDRSLIVQKNDIKKYIEIMLSRGCPYDCYYCCNNAIASIYPSRKRYFRLPSIDWSMRFLENTLKQYPETQYIEFIDDLLIADKKWFLDFAEEYKKRIKLPYRLCGRFEVITPEIVKALKDSGCIRILFGVESGDEILRQKFLKRKHSNDFILEKCDLVKNAGITICSLNMIGLPFETREQMNSTLNLNKKIAPEFGTCFFFHPYKGTQLYDVCKEYKLIADEEKLYEITSNYVRPFIKLTRISERECICFQKKISLYFFIQTFKYRCKAYNSSRRGIRKVLLLWIVIKLLFKGIKLYYSDYLKRSPILTSNN